MSSYIANPPGQETGFMAIYQRLTNTTATAGGGEQLVATIPVTGKFRVGDIINTYHTFTQGGGSLSIVFKIWDGSTETTMATVTGLGAQPNGCQFGFVPISATTAQRWHTTTTLVCSGNSTITDPTQLTEIRIYHTPVTNNSVVNMVLCTRTRGTV